MIIIISTEISIIINIIISIVSIIKNTIISRIICTISLITKARPGGPHYVYSLLQGYEDPPKGFVMAENTHYNKYMQGNIIAMPSPLHNADLVSFDDGTDATIEQMAHDVVNFLQWVAEPEMEKRKALGAKAIIFAIIMTVFFYLSKKQIWSKLKK